MMMLLFRSSAGLVAGGAFQQSVQLAGNGALEAAADLALALALGDAAAGIGPGRPVMDLAQHHDGVQGPIQLPVPTTVDSLGRLWCQAGAWLILTLLGGASRLVMGKVASCPASRCDLPCASSAL
jgi:hypothetical protein